MKRILLISFIGLLIASCSNKTTYNELRVLQFNIWQEGTQVEGGFDAIINEIIRSKADLITLSEVRNYNNIWLDKKLVEALKKKGYTYYSLRSQDSGLLSAYPIKKQTALYPVEDDRGSITKALIDVDGTEVVLYSAHLDYRNCALYLPRGYDGSTWAKLKTPVTDVKVIEKDNLASKRDDAIQIFLEDAKQELHQGRLVFLGGDFNEASHLDWTEATKNLYDHNGVVMVWNNTVALQKAGYRDTYREKFSDPLTHPGFTYPADNSLVDIKRLVWSPDADDRDRIDYIFYYPDERLELKEVYIIGPKGSICKNQRIIETLQDSFVEPLDVWPTDHKAVLAVFYLNSNAK